MMAVGADRAEGGDTVGEGAKGEDVVGALGRGRIDEFENGDGNGNGRWAVSLRCAELSEDRRTARLVAGGGIVADSDPRSELAETQAKFQAMLSAIVRP